MKSLDILGANRFETSTETREACRGIVLKENDILLTYEVNTDQWFIPGGGLENGENPQECCTRELAEETGYVVKPGKHFLTIHEYYEEWHFISHYFVCELIGETERNLTERELSVGLKPRWIPLQDAIDIFSKHNDYAAENEMKRGAYLREYQALLEFVNELLYTKGGPPMIETRCGLHCTGCTFKEPCNCGGCIGTNGHPFHGECPVAICCQRKGFTHCGECPDIPCELLTQYSCDPVHGDTPPGARIEQCKKWAEK